MSKKQIILLGGGGHCKACIDVIEQSGEYEIVGILDKKEKVGSRVLNSVVIGTDENLPELIRSIRNCLVTIGQIKSAEHRRNLYQLIKESNGTMPVIISPSAYVSKHAYIGEGTIVMHNAIINAGARVGNNCIINTNALVEHDAIIGDHCHISTGAIINGGVNVGASSFVGSGAISVQDTSIPENSFVKAQTLFIK